MRFMNKNISLGVALALMAMASAELVLIFGIVRGQSVVYRYQRVFASSHYAVCICGVQIDFRGAPLGFGLDSFLSYPCVGIGWLFPP
jgi:hypothetical protein